MKLPLIKYKISGIKSKVICQSAANHLITDFLAVIFYMF